MWPRILQLGAAIVALSGVAYLAYDDAWPFDEGDRQIGDDPSVWELVLSDGPTRGFARLLLAAFAVYLVASVGALIVAGRWLRGFGTTGMSIDAAKQASKTLDEYEKQVDNLTQQLAHRDRIALDLEGKLTQAESALRFFRDQADTSSEGSKTRPADHAETGAERPEAPDKPAKD